MMTTTHVRTPMAVRSTSQQVVVVSKQSQLNGLLETVLDAGQYDVVFVESTEHAYSHIKRLTPHLIIVCLDIDDLDGFQVLSMLKLDDDTKGFPSSPARCSETTSRRRTNRSTRRTTCSTSRR